MSETHVRITYGPDYAGILVVAVSRRSGRGNIERELFSTAVPLAELGDRKSLGALFDSVAAILHKRWPAALNQPQLPSMGPNGHR